MKVAEQDCRFRTRDDKYEENQEEKTEHVVYLARPGEKKPVCLTMRERERERKNNCARDTHQSELSIKNNCMNMHPKGKTPPMITPGIGCV